jgi:parallel beta-helix repeat protein
MKNVLVSLVIVIFGAANVARANFEIEWLEPTSNSPCHLYSKNYGVVSDSEADQTQLIQKMLDTSRAGQTVCIAAGTYRVDATKSLLPKNGTRLVLSSQAVLKALPNNQGNSAVIKIVDGSDIEIMGGTIEGERHEHLGTSGEWGMGIQIMGSKNIRISNMKITNCWGDGIYIGRSANVKAPFAKNIHIDQIVADGNRRQGISVIAGVNITIENSVFQNTNGISPAAGIDLEPNAPDELLYNVKIRNIRTAKNSYGVMIYLQNHNMNSQSHIVVDGHVDEKSKVGLLVYGSKTKGVVRVINSSWENSILAHKIKRNCQLKLSLLRSSPELPKSSTCVGREGQEF